MLKSYYALVLCDSPCDAQDTVERMQAQGLDATAVGQGVQVSRQFTCLLYTSPSPRDS